MQQGANVSNVKNNDKRYNLETIPYRRVPDTPYNPIQMLTCKYLQALGTNRISNHIELHFSHATNISDFGIFSYSVSIHGDSKRSRFGHPNPEHLRSPSNETNYLLCILSAMRRFSPDFTSITSSRVWGP